MIVSELIHILSGCKQDANILILRNFKIQSIEKIEQYTKALKGNNGIILSDNVNDNVVLLS